MRTALDIITIVWDVAAIAQTLGGKHATSVEMIEKSRQLRKLRRAVLVGVIAVHTFLWDADAIYAGHNVFHIFTPAIEKGEWSAELITAFHSGFPGHFEDDHHGNVRAASELGLQTYPTHYWMTKVAVEFEHEAGGEFEPVAFASKNVLSLQPWMPPHLSAGWFTEVSAGLADEATNAVEFGPVATIAAGQAALTLNPFLEKTFGRNREEGLAFVYAYRATYSFTDSFSIGVEGYGEIENIGEALPSSEQVHRFGPVLYFGAVHGLGHEPHHHEHSADAHMSDQGHLHAEVGLLFGLTDGTPDTALKANLGLDF